ncbi:MAG TPA: hypothetical protein VK879_18675, partial [Candidatus Sulfomarinibacteraceae bacterium]|nr:hypothetical protein [Candidatus Sulfomarinibacteraceae bacterium]
MPISLLVAPGGAGKTDYALQLVRQTTDGLHQLARVCVANRQQAMSWQRRLVQGPGDRPGHIGVEVMTFDDLYAACLDAAGWTVTRIDETVEHRLIRAAAQQLDLAHYGALRQRPGFIQELRRLIGEFKSTQLRPQQLADGIEALGNEARLREVVQLYKRYNDLLQEQQWTDSRGLGWMALAALQGDSASHAYAWPRAHLWPLLIVDGFDSFTQTQLALLKQLGQRVDRLIITLTGDAGADTPRRAHRRFHRTRRELEQRLNVTAQPLPARSARPAPRGALAHLRENLFVGSTTQQPDDGAVHMLEAPTPAVEVREALRWLKRRIVDEGARPHELALLARDLQPYTPFIQQTAAEFQLPVYILGGLSLAQNPCIAALLNLLRLMLPADDNGAQQQTDSWQPALPRRPVLAALRSPYFDWRSALDLTATDVAQLDVLARQWRVVGGRKQWLEALSAAAATPQSARPDPESGERVASAPQGETARALREKFRSFLHRIRPLRGQHPWREHVSWLEALLGPDDAEPTSHSSTDNSLRVIACARAGAEAGENDQLQVARRDIAALHKLKNILRSLLWAEDAGLLNPPLSFTEFVEELASAVDTARYQPHAACDASLVAPRLQTRGVTYRAVALVGLAEGTFPATLTEDPFLRESDRRRLREEHHFSLESS